MCRDFPNDPVRLFAVGQGGDITKKKRARGDRKNLRTSLRCDENSAADSDAVRPFCFGCGTQEFNDDSRSLGQAMMHPFATLPPAGINSPPIYD